LSDSEHERKRQLECLRLISDLQQLAGSTPNLNLKLHCIRMTGMWTDHAQKTPKPPMQMFLHPNLLAETAPSPGPIVLIVEDDPFLRMLAVDIIEEAGFVALEAGDADEAVALLESRLDISLLFTDVEMPGSMDGLKLAHAVRARWPLIKILVVSGKARLQLCDLPSNSCLVEKPYQAAKMLKKLRSLIGSP
jgi:CheY-like chemotaxis protein